MIVCLAVLFLAASASGLQTEDLPAIPNDGELWAVLVAGSNGWYNYRHQADVCHAYQIVSAHGVPDDHIIVMMYDDIANNEENPTPGKIFNHPNGSDVYHGVPKDYTCTNVNPKAFLQVLRGEKMDVGSGKTLKSGPNDHVFIYFSDHGAKGLVAFGESVLKASDLHQTILAMHANKQYAKLLFYLEACESGSMFKGLLSPHLNVYATTASNATTSSYACYYDETYKTFLGDVYSVKWMEDSDKENIEQETLEHQFLVVRNETNTSTVCQFGDMSINKLPVGFFQGTKPLTSTAQYPPSWYSCGKDAVPAPDVPIRILEKMIQTAATPEETQAAKDKLKAMLQHRQSMEGVVRRIVDQLTATDGDFNAILTHNVELTQFDCYYAAVDAFHDRCYNLGKNDYALRMLNVFVNLCENKYPVDNILGAIEAQCTHAPIHGIY